MRSLSIAFLVPHFNTPDQASSLRSPQIAFYLGDQGHHVTTLAPGVDQRNLQPFPEMKGKLFATYDLQHHVTLVRVRTLSDFRKSPLRRFLYDLVFAILAFLRMLVIRPLDVIIVSYPPSIMPLFAVILAKLRRVPIVFEVRDLVADALEESRYVKSSVFRRLAQLAEQIVVHASDHIITVSRGIQEILVKKGADPAKFTVIPLGYAQEVFDSADYSFDARDSFDWGDRFVVIYTGSLTPAYDIPTLLRAAERLSGHPDILFAIVGNGELRTGYQQFCEQRAMTNCQFIDYQPRKKLPAILTDANVGVHLFRNDPLWSYVLGNKTFDYLASGLPMIYAGTGDTADLIRTADAGIVITPEDDEGLANAILLLASQPQLVQRLGQNGKQHILSNYAVNDLLKRLDGVLARVVRPH